MSEVDKLIGFTFDINKMIVVTVHLTYWFRLKRYEEDCSGATENLIETVIDLNQIC